MRTKDILQILIAVGSVIYVAYQFVNKIDRMQDGLNTIRIEIVEMRRTLADHIREK